MLRIAQGAKPGEGGQLPGAKAAAVGVQNGWGLIFLHSFGLGMVGICLILVWVFLKLFFGVFF